MRGRAPLVFASLFAASVLADRDTCRDKLRELCHGTTAEACLRCAADGAAALRDAGCQNPRIEGLCNKVRVRVEAKGFAGKPKAHSGSLFSMRSSDLACNHEGSGDASCEYRPLDSDGTLCLESSTDYRDNYFITATSMLADANHSVFPATHMLQLRAHVDIGPLNTTTTLQRERTGL